jgi:hypothetical protein
MSLDPEEEAQEQDNEPYDGDWCLVDLGEPITEEATTVAHALGLSFEQFMHLALEEKLAPLRGDEALMRSVKDVRWEHTLKGIVEIGAKVFASNRDAGVRKKTPSDDGADF